MIEFEKDLKKSPLHFFTAITKNEVKFRSFLMPTVWYKQGYELTPLFVTPMIFASVPQKVCTGFDLLKMICLRKKTDHGPADEIVVILEERDEALVSWIRPKEIKTMKFRIFNEFGTRIPGDIEEIEDPRFESFKQFLN